MLRSFKHLKRKYLLKYRHLKSIFLYSRPRQPFLEKLLNISLPSYIQYCTTREVCKSKILGTYCCSYGYEDEPIVHKDFISTVLFKLNDDLTFLLGEDYRVNKVRFWRNLHIPPSESYRDYYSNIFHQDVVYDYFCVQLFILIDQVNIDDGPFEWFSMDRHILVHPLFKNRLKLENFNFANTLPTDLNPNRLVGKRGDALLLNTGYHYHRDGVPELNHDRRIISLSFFPNYSNIGTPSSSLLQWK